MHYRTKVIDIELSRPITTIKGLGGYRYLKGLVRLHGAPIGYIQLPVLGEHCPAASISKAILDQHSWAIIRRLINDRLTAPQADRFRIDDLLNESHPTYCGPFPLVTVAVCTRDRTADLALCLDALCHLDYPNLDLLVVDNAPASDATERLVCENYPQVRYVREPRPGLNWARNRAIMEARGEIIAYTDDDVIVDPGWIKALAQVFVEDPEVMTVTGLVVPYELETKQQILFEEYGGFGRGFERQWYRVAPKSGWRVASLHGWTGKFGTGANMAYRLSLFEQIGHFDPALDVGTVTNGGGDIEMFFRVLCEGYTLVYEPNALVRHRHRRDYRSLYKQIANNGIGFSAYLVRSALVYPSERLAILRFWLRWLRRWHLPRLTKSILGRERFPRDLILAELRGYFVGLGRYTQARRKAKKLVENFGTHAVNLQSAEVTGR